MESDHCPCDFCFYILSLSGTLENRIVKQMDVGSDLCLAFIFIFLRRLRDS